MEISREIKTLRSSLLVVKSSLESARSPELQYLTKELGKQLLFLNKIDQLLNKPNAAKEDLAKVLENATESFTLVFDNRQALRQMDLSVFEGARPVKVAEAQRSSRSRIKQSSGNGIESTPERTQLRELVCDPLQ